MLLKNNIAIIPARGGSKRIPKKNIRDFSGKPIIAYSIETALNSNLFDEVMVSTDDKEIAEIAIKYGAKVPFLRSKKNSDDYTVLSEVIIEVLNQYKENGTEFNNICCILATAPFLIKTDLINSYNKLTSNLFDSVFPVVRYSYPIQRAMHFEGDKIVMIWPENMNKRSQEMKPSFHDAGLFYWSKSKIILNQKKLWTDNTTAFEISSKKAQDIDSEEDWKIAELKFKLLNKITD